jgi:hypothetical protein
MKRRQLDLGKARQALEADPNWELVTIEGREMVQRISGAKGHTPIRWEVVQSGYGECNIEVAALLDTGDDAVFTIGMHEGLMHFTGIHVRGALAGVDERLPIHPETFRRLGLAAISQQIGREMHEPWLRYLLSGLDDDAWVDAFALARRPGRKGRNDYFYAVLAQDYVDSCVRTNHPVPELAAKRNYSVRTIRNQLGEARRRELLTAPPERGTSGGDLTPKAIALLKGNQQ